MMGISILMHSSTMAKALQWPLHLHPNLTKLNRGREAIKDSTRVKHKKSVPLIRASLKHK